MPDPKTTPVAEAPEHNASEQDVVDQQDSFVDDVVNEGSVDDNAEESNVAEESSTSEKTDDVIAAAVEAAEASGEVDDVAEFMPSEKKDNVQKRIDQLTAQIKQLKEENGKLKISDKPEPKEVEYTEAQLKGALKKAFDEGDHELAWEIIDYRAKKSERDLVKRYEEAQSHTINQQKQVHQEWNKVVNDYSKAWATDDGAELYHGAKDELSLGSESSLLYRLAMKFYHETVDDEGRPVYHRDGGQRMAVADAMNAILRKRKLSPNETKTKKLERSLAKAKRKATTPASNSSDGETPRRARSSGDSLADYMSERKKFLYERK